MSSIMDEIEEGINVSTMEEDSTSQRPNADQAQAQDNAEEDLLGLDKPIKLRTRAKIAKIDNARIFSPNGIPYIVKNHGKLLRTIQKNDKKFYSNSRGSITKTQKFEHEFDNLSSVLQFYQLWCHGLFPKANFKDCIHLVRSLNGKSAQLRMYRRELINVELHKLKVAKGIITEVPDTEETRDMPLENNDGWNTMHMNAVTVESNDTNGNTASGLESLFVDSNSTEDLNPSNEPSLFVDSYSTQDLTPSNNFVPTNDSTSASTSAALPAPTTVNNKDSVSDDDDDDDPFSDDDLDMTMEHDAQLRLERDEEQQQHQPEEHIDDDLELELMRQNDP